MHEQQREQTHALLRARGLDHALFASPASVAWLTGFAPPIQLGPHPFSGGPPLLWYAGDEWTLIVLDGYAEAAAESGIAVLSYLGYTIDAPIDGPRGLLAALRTVVDGAGRIGAEERALPLFLRAALPEGATIVALDGALAPLRIIKTTEELDKLRASFALTDIGQAAARAAVRPGQTELDVWAALQTAITKAAGRRVPLGNDCTIGRRAHSGGWPLDVEIQPGDSFVVDLSTQLRGYWSDSCATYYADAPSRRQAALHTTVAEALELAISLIRPGAIASQIDRQLRAFMVAAGYPVYFHHTGHGVGVTVHEEPRIVPYNDMRIEPGMVIMLEPGVYFPDETAIRLEHAVLVTASGAEVLTKHATSLP
ncbi:MAG: M24 family metallopeptidase [Roseiflexaceae bacterium]